MIASSLFLIILISQFLLTASKDYFSRTSDPFSNLPEVTIKSINRCKNEKSGKNYLNQSMITALEGDSIIIRCSHCPELNYDLTLIWRYIPASTVSCKPVDFSKDRLKMNQFFDLIITDAALSDSGIYFCTTPDYLMITVLNVALTEPREVTMNRAVSPKRPVNIRGSNLQVYLSPGPYSDCNRCNSLGLKSRLESCFIKKIDKTKPVYPVDITAFRKIPSLPCRSFLVPEPIKQLKEIANYKSRMNYRLCRTKCINRKTVQIYDSKGKLVDFASQSQELYSPLDPLPNLQGSVARLVIIRMEGESIVMSCPGSTSNVRWFNGSFILNPLRVHRRTKGRVKINFLYQLRIRRLKFYDKQVYNCKRDGKLVGSIYLNVIPASQSRIITRFFSFSGAYVIVISFLMITLSIIRNRQVVRQNI